MQDMFVVFCLFVSRQNNNFCLFCDVFPICNFANHFFYWVRKLETSLCVKYRTLRPSLVAQAVKRLPTMRETRVRSLGREDPLEKEMATHSSILAWKIPWTEELGWLLSMGSQRVGHDWATSLFTSIFKSLIYVTMKIIEANIFSCLKGAKHTFNFHNNPVR